MKKETTYNPIVAIIIPVYNGSNYVEEAIISALDQSYKKVKVIVVNDGSSDNGKTRDVILRYIDRITYIEKENGGVSSALNEGIKNTEADYICWLSHDDVYRYDKVEIQINALRNIEDQTEKIIVGCNDVLIDSSGNSIRQRNTFKKNILFTSAEFLKLLLLKTNVNGCSLLIPKDVFLTNQFDYELRYIQDYYMWINLALQGCQFMAISEYCVYNRVHGLQQTNLITNKTFLTERKLLDDFLLYTFFNTKNDDYKKVIYLFLRTSNNSDLRVQMKRVKDYKKTVILEGQTVLILIKKTILMLFKKCYNLIYISRFRR